MITHVILIQPKVSTSNEKLLALLEHIQALKDIIPGILSISVGENLSLYHRGFTYGVIMRFVDEVHLQAHHTHPAHVAVVTELDNLCQQSIDFDLPEPTLWNFYFAYLMKEPASMYTDRLTTTLIDLIRIPSTSGHEEKIRTHLSQYLTSLGLSTTIDGSGNLISTLAGVGAPLLLNAHMDRVPPGLGHQPILRNGVLFSDGTTNLGADDAAGIAIILEVVRRMLDQALPHPPLVIVFTVEEEAGLCGASNFVSTSWNVADGIVFDNAYEAGIVVSKGAAYEAFDVEITGRTGHPGKDLAQTVHAIEIFRLANYPHGSFDNDQTRINVGKIVGGNARNAIPDIVTIEGELRSFETSEVRQKYKQAIQDAFEQAARLLGGHAKVSFKTHTNGYEIDPEEPLLAVYRTILEQRGLALHMKPTFVGSDTSGFRPTIRVFTLSTGVVNEHSTEEHVAIDPLEKLVIDTLQILALWSKR